MDLREGMRITLNSNSKSLILEIDGFLNSQGCTFYSANGDCYYKENRGCQGQVSLKSDRHKTIGCISFIKDNFKIVNNSVRRV